MDRLASTGFPAGVFGGLLGAVSPPPHQLCVSMAPATTLWLFSHVATPRAVGETVKSLWGRGEGGASSYLHLFTFVSKAATAENASIPIVRKSKGRLKRFSVDIL